MEKIISLTKLLLDDSTRHPHLDGLSFVAGEYFGWNHEKATITFDSSDTNAGIYILHEYSHAVLNHTDYTKDIQLIAMERDAWALATELAPKFERAIDTELVEDSLDTYRNWLHDRSLCPKCSATGVQISAKQYQCIACHAKWTVNEARTCALRRYEAK